MNRNSLRHRVTFFYVALLAVALLTFSVAVYLGVRAFITRSLEHSLSMNASTILTDYIKPLDSKGSAWFQNEMSESYPTGVSDTFVRVSRGQEVLYETGEMRGLPISASALASAGDADTSGEVNRTYTKSGQEILTYTLLYRQPQGDPIVIETGATTEPIRHVLRSLFLILLTGTPIILIAAALGGYVLMAHALRPVETLTEQAERVGREDLGERLPVIPSGDELERLSLALNRMIERLEETVAHNRRFSADASHELRTPLTIIRGELEVVMQTPMLSPALIEGIGSALEESDRMSHIVESLMTISRLEGGSEQMAMMPVDLIALATETLDHMSLLAEEKEIKLTCATSGSIYVMGDAMRLKQVVANLLDNAIKYTPANGSVAMSIAAEGSLAALEVSDTGIGIPVDALPLVFERFFRADKTRSRGSGGIGLGLAIVKSICIAHHGTVTVSSIEGHGTTLRVELPLLHEWTALKTAEQVSVVTTHHVESLPERKSSVKERHPVIGTH
ncbi:sensor histidine kinase [Terriglobus sp. 2YAB30_2]|uniref:sensor histidine kinase n=2 Tax=unclassified Terriglobus TaxID=2628988 RepID=UPI003F9BBAED